MKKSAQQYNKEYKPELERRRQLAQQRESKEHQGNFWCFFLKKLKINVFCDWF